MYSEPPHIDSSGGNHDISSVISLLLLLYSDISSVVTMMSLVWSSILLSSLLAGCDAISCTRYVVTTIYRFGQEVTILVFKLQSYHTCLVGI